MYVLYYILLSGIILSLWLIVGRYEWKLPDALREKLSTITVGKEEAIPAYLTLNIGALEFNHGDIEKEIYIIRKARRVDNQDMVMNVEIHTPEDILSETEKGKIKVRLERRFPGMTIYFAPKEGEEKCSFMC